MSRRRYTEKERADCLAEFERSGSSAAVFCREKGLAYQTFLNWRRRRGALSLEPKPRTSESWREQLREDPLSRKRFVFLNLNWLLPRRLPSPEGEDPSAIPTPIVS